MDYQTAAHVKQRKSFVHLKREVIATGLCTHCGTCEGVCPVAAIRMDDVLGECLPVENGTCISCGKCVACCPGNQVLFSELQPNWSLPRRHPWLGGYQAIFQAYAADESIRYKGASGGMGTRFAWHLLESKRVDGVVVLDFDVNMPWIPVAKLCTRPEQLIRAAQSKYFLYPQNRILRTIREQPVDSVAVFALPCQTHGLRKAIQAGVPGTEKIRYILGLYCGNNLFYEATRSLFRRFRILDFNRIRRIAYREGTYPGGFRIQYHNKEFFLDKFTFNYLSFFYTPRRCLTCIDLSNELADISIGDAWKSRQRTGSDDAASLFIVRNPELEQVFYEGIEQGYYVARPLYEKEALFMHANVLVNKKIGAFARIQWLKRWHKPVPEYDRSPLIISKFQHAFEGFMLILLHLFRTRTMQAMSHHIPLFLLKPLMTWIRGGWRRKTAKRYNLSNEE